MALQAAAMTARSSPPLATALPPAFAEAIVLVVDDHESNVTLLERTLRSAGITRVHTLMDSREVVAQCLKLQPDLILLDLHMPHMDGYDVLDALRAALPDGTFLPVLVLTSDATSHARERALDAGAKDFLTKPFDRVETLQRIRNLLETRALFDTLQQRNAELYTELAQRTEIDRRVAAEHDEQRIRVEQVLKCRSLAMVFQPIADLDTADIVGVEALARFNCEPRRPPNEWFDEAAEVDLGTELELAAVKSALHQLEQLPPNTFMSVNVSPATAVSVELGIALRKVPAAQVVLELTEHTRVQDYEQLLAALADLRSEGVRIAVDDAGAGYAGLQQLLRLEPDIIKLDIDLTRGIHSDPARRALAGALVTFAKEISAVIVAEGIETEDDLCSLRELGVPWGQGFHLARPGALPLDS
jgi:EAL domain-containing protein (putative c-di-GMP-specific phosphodiesterase class I)/AmiR/NasT family two-component response regulator